MYIRKIKETASKALIKAAITRPPLTPIDVFNLHIHFSIVSSVMGFPLPGMICDLYMEELVHNLAYLNGGIGILMISTLNSTELMSS